MALTVEQLVADPELATRVIAGAAGLARTIQWAHVCELAEPWQWVGAGDLLMTTGLGIPSSAGQQAAYVERLAAVGAAGVALGEDMNAPPLHQQMLAAADAHGLPLLLTRYEIPFIALARAVAEASTEARLARIAQTERVYEVLRRGSADEVDLADLLGSLEAVVGCELFVVDPLTGRSVVRGTSIPAPLREAVLRWSPGEQEEPPARLAVPKGHASGVLLPTARPAALLACSSGLLPDDTVLRHLAAVTALHQTRLFAERERTLRVGATLLAALLDQRISAAAARGQLTEAGLAPDKLVLAACAIGERPDPHLLHHQLSEAGLAHLMLTRPPLTYVLLADDPEAVATLADVLPAGAAAGISDPLPSASDLPTAQRQSHWALHRAQERRLRLLRHSDDLGDSVFLPGDREDSRAAARRVLGAVLAYDAAHDSRLVESLQAFLLENRSWQRASRRLHIHKQTLVYRIRRVEELTTRSLSDTGDVADLWLALQAATASGLVER